MPATRLYLAGPDVFLPDAVQAGLRKKMLCEEFGFIGLYPLDNDRAGATGERLDEEIFSANVALMRQADAGIFNLSPFRGVNADAGLIMLDHEEIPGLMDAMEMQYEVKPASKAAGFAVGDRVEFDVDGRNLVILDIRKAPAGK